MNVIRGIDEGLMRLLTFNWRYRDLDKRPQTTIAALMTLGAIWITVVMISFKSQPVPVIVIGLFLCLFFWLTVFYEWRLWYRLRKCKAKRDK